MNCRGIVLMTAGGLFMALGLGALGLAPSTSQTIIIGFWLPGGLVVGYLGGRVFLDDNRERIEGIRLEFWQHIFAVLIPTGLVVSFPCAVCLALTDRFDGLYGGWFIPFLGAFVVYSLIIVRFASRALRWLDKHSDPPPW